MLIRHTAMNLAGLGLPLLAAVVTIPLLIAGLGEARFGLLALIWAVVGYFGLFDLGLGRALTLHLAPALARADRARAGRLAGTALALLAAAGCGAGVLMVLAAGSLVALIRDLPDVGEARAALVAMAVAMPFVVVSAGLRGVLEADHRFGVINAIRIPMGLFTFVGPLLVLTAGVAQVDTIAWVLAAGRVLACAAHAAPALGVLRRAGARATVDAGALRTLAGSAGWFTVSNLVAPLMNTVDRFVIGAWLSVTAVAHYATPHEMITKLGIVPTALTAVLFPRFATQLETGDGEAGRTYRRSLWALAAVLLPVIVALTVWAEPLLAAWIDPAFARHSAPVLQVLAWGMFATCLAALPFTVLQSAGAVRLTALLHLAELAPYLALLAWATAQHGLVGAALAWSVRCAVDALLLFAFAARTLRRRPPLPVPA